MDGCRDEATGSAVSRHPTAHESCADCTHGGGRETAPVLELPTCRRSGGRSRELDASTWMPRPHDDDARR